jgi:hypothetical protein
MTMMHPARSCDRVGVINDHSDRHSDGEAAMVATLKVLVSFSGSNGLQPAGSVIADANGDLFGTTERGGTYGDGTPAFFVTTMPIIDPDQSR